MLRYDYLLFDVDNTLLDFDRAEHDALVDCLRDFGYPTDEALVNAYSAVNDRHWKMLERGEIDRATLLWKRFEVFLAECSLPPMDPHALCEAYVERLSQKSYMLDGALEVCGALAERYTLCAITNGNTRVQKGRFEPSPLRPLFRGGVFVSEQMGVNKPSQAYFDLVCAALSQREKAPVPSRMLVIGDSLSSDIAGGLSWGTDTCWLCPKRERWGEAAARGLNPTYTVARLRELLDILR